MTIRVDQDLSSEAYLICVKVVQHTLLQSSKPTYIYTIAHSHDTISHKLQPPLQYRTSWNLK